MAVRFFDSLEPLYNIEKAKSALPLCCFLLFVVDPFVIVKKTKRTLTPFSEIQIKLKVATSMQIDTESMPKCLWYVRGIHIASP